MKLEEIVYDIRTLLNELGDDSDYTDSYLIYKVNNVREALLQRAYDRTGYFNPLWIQQFDAERAITVNSADDVNVQETSVVYSKLELPQTISFEDRDGIVRVAGGANQRSISLITQGALINFIESEDPMLKEMKAYFKIGNIIYVYPTEPYLKVFLVLNNPLDGITYKELKDPNTGTIISANGIRRNLTILDEYPIDGSMVELLLQQLLTVDFQFEKQMVQDVVNDKADTLNLSRYGGSTKA